ncbi:hypothetical protein BHM03_00060883 [Ensete ventricosum]|nr:hypothetical protein BHM03_00060883 [Ensete ventricosum]
MQWDFIGSSLRDSPKGSGSSLGTRWEIIGRRLEVSIPEAIGLAEGWQVNRPYLGVRAAKPPRCLEESFFPDLEKDFSLGRIERGVRESRNGRLGPLHSSSRGSRRWGSGRFGSRSLLVLTFACY